MPDRRSLPPMEATEFAIEKAFRHCFFALGLVIGWIVLLLPLIALAWFVAFRDRTPDFRALSPAALAALGLLGLGVLLACFSIGVNWNRRILLDERPSFLGRWRLDGAVWRYIGGVALMLVVLAIYAGAGAAVMMAAVPSLAPTIGAAAQPLGIAVAALIGLSALFTLLRLLSWLPGLATAEEGYTLGTAWRTTRANRFAFLGLSFWLLFSLAIAGGIGAGAFFAQQSLPQPWVKPVAFAVIGVLAWLAALVVHSVPAALHRAFR
ncbi:MAG: hypothetical protein U1E16_02030 [Hyphomicrobiales bacterium]